MWQIKLEYHGHRPTQSTNLELVWRYYGGGRGGQRTAIFQPDRTQMPHEQRFHVLLLHQFAQ
jgi:hypothetical protein